MHLKMSRHVTQRFDRGNLKLLHDPFSKLTKLAAILILLAVVTLQAFTRGKSFYLGKISLGKFTSGFIFPWLKGHTGDHWIKF